MRKRKPDGAELQQTGSAGIEDAARDVDVSDGVAVEKQVAVLQVIKERRDGDGGG